jgi:tetratricopeptide (TPR) repeat protein
VKPVAVPTAPAKPDEAAIHILLQDQQVDMQPGRVTRFTENVLRIQTPQGLAAGSVSFAWNPDTQVATVHKLLIHRGDKVIDVLASGQRFTVVRRETNLENAVLDGVLTATIQPEGLQVGDILDFAASIAETDPALHDHVEEVGGGWNGVPFDRAHLRVQWPAGHHVQVRGTIGLAAPKIDRKDGLSDVEYMLDALTPIPVPKGAPSRYGLMRVAEFSDFATWSDLSALMAPLYAKASTLPANGVLQKEIAAIAAQSTDPKVRAEAALTLVQDRIRYVFLGMNDGGLVPADAETTWGRRFGDCKGKTVVLLALLKGLGIEAEPALVSSAAGDGLDQRLPMVALFDHVLVRATIAGKIYWLDGTRTGDKSLDKIVTPNFRWGLPLVPKASLVRMDAPSPPQPLTETTIRIDATAGISIPAPTHVETILRDDIAVFYNQQLSNLSPDVRDQALRQYWRGQYDFIDVKSASAAFDAGKREEKLVLDGEAKMDWSTGWYETDGTGVGYKPDFTRDPGPNRDAPYAVAFPFSTRTQETILLPPGNFRVDHGEAIDQSVAGITYHRSANMAGNRFTVDQSEQSIEREISATEAQAAESKLRALADRNVFLGKPGDYSLTEQELAVAMRTEPASANDLVTRGNALLNRQRLDEAMNDFTKAIALDPHNATAYADRGFVYIQKQDLAAAARDFDAADKIDPRNAIVYRGRGALAEQRGAIRDAVTAYSRSLDFDPDSGFALWRRAENYWTLTDYDRALADTDELVRRQPEDLNVYVLRANIFRAQGHIDTASHEAIAAAAIDPKQAYGYVVAARIYAACGKQTEAMGAFDTALKLQPAAYIYINRNTSRPRDDFAGREADLAAAAKIEPKSTELFAARAQLQEDQKAFTSAVETWTESLALLPTDGFAMVRRGIDQQRLGRIDLAAKDFAAAHGLAKDADGLNMLCWEKATAGVALDMALSECNAALAHAPERADLLDSLGFVQLRLGHFADAITEYGKALAVAPGQSASLYGLALAEKRAGDVAKADMNRQAALKISPDVATTFSRYGMIW